jgi:glycosyltransferase involved in cell wall biosynthesis
MKIVYCIGSLANPGGTERVLASKANYLVEKMNYEVHILIVDQKNAPLCFEFSSKVIIHDMKVPSEYSGYQIPGITYLILLNKMSKSYSKRFEEIKPDVVIVVERGFHDFVIPYINKDIPKIREFHFSKGAVDLRASIMKPYLTKIRYKILYKLLYLQFKKYDKLVLLTKEDQKSGNYGRNTIVIENMLDFYPDKSSDCMGNNVISVGSMYDDRKGFHKQIEIWGEIKEEFPEWKLNIFGDGNRLDFLKKMVNDKGLEKKVILHGRSSAIPKKLTESSIFIMTSEAEGLPMVLIEAMSAGLPCVAYDCPTGPDEIINNNEDGYVVKLNDQKQFVEKLKILMGNDGLRVEMGSKARINSQKFLPENIMPLWDKLFIALKNNSKV